MAEDIRWITFAEADQRYGGGSGGNASLLLTSSGNTNDIGNHPYTAQNSGIIVTDANGVEVFRLWASDPDPTFTNYDVWNLYIGYHAGFAQGSDQSTNPAYENTGIGYKALESITTGPYNTAVGVETLNANTEGTRNVAIGVEALYLNTTGSGNVAVGSQALGNKTIGPSGNTTGDNNTAVGTQAMPEDTAGTSSGCTAVGRRAGELANAATDCVWIGNTCTPSAGGTTNTIGIGANITTTGSDVAVIGNFAITDVYFGGQATASAKIHGKGDAIVFPDADPHVAGAAYWVGGVLTKSAG